MDLSEVLRARLPLLTSLRGYRRGDFAADALAGAIVGMVTIPQAVAYAVLAGLPAEAGLYACLVPMLCYALLGSSRELVVGPVAVAAIMVAATVHAHLDAFGGNYAALTSVLCVEVGVLLFALRALGLSGFVNLISQPVLSGFINAAVLLIVVSQLDDALGIADAAAGSVVAHVVHVVVNAPMANLVTLALFGGGLAILVAVRGLGPPLLRRLRVDDASARPLTRIGPLLAVMAGGGIVAVFGLDGLFGVTTVGFVPDGLPTLVVPPTDPALWLRLVPSAAMIALVAYIESWSLGQSLAATRDGRLDADQELIALGAASLAAGFSGAYPVAGSVSRSGVNVAAGARTQVSSLVCAVVIVVTLLLATPLLASLPHAVLAAIVIVSVLPMFDVAQIGELWRIYRGDALTHVATLMGVLLFDVETGIGIGVVLSIAMFLRRSAVPDVTEVGRLGSSTQFRSVRRFDVEVSATTLLLRVDESLYFANVDHIERQVFAQLRARPDCQHLVLVFTPVNYVDVDGLQWLLRLNAFCAEQGLRLHLAGVKMELWRRILGTGLPQALTGEVFESADAAARALASPQPTEALS